MNIKAKRPTEISENGVTYCYLFSRQLKPGFDNRFQSRVMELFRGLDADKNVI